jgi:hypothetical protein
MKLTGKNRSTRGKTLSLCLFVHHNHYYGNSPTRPADRYIVLANLALEIERLWVILGFRRSVNDILAFLGRYAA